MAVRSRNPTPVTRPLVRIRGSVTKAISAHDPAPWHRLHCRLSTWRPLSESLVWPCPLVVLNELTEHVLQVTTTRDQ